MKVKSVAASTDLPDDIRAGVPRPELPEEEKAALHNVTSGLYNRAPVKQAIERAVAAVCEALEVPVPEKGKRSKKTEREEPEEQPADTITSVEESGVDRDSHALQSQAGDEEVTDFEGFESDIDEPGPLNGVLPREGQQVDEDEASKYDHLLGSSSDEDEDVDMDDAVLARFRGKEKVNLDDISLSGSGASSGSDSDVESGAESSSNSELAPPVPSKKAGKRASQSTATPARAGNSTFLPSLMGGYISGSESASDIDAPPPKKRRGQRARQAIHEKKFGAKARHLQNGGGRDAGWDMRRGAVDGDGPAGRTPWKNGVSSPFGGKNGRDTPAGQDGMDGTRVEVKRAKDNEGALHPSWEARKKAKDSQKDVAFSGQKITFD